MEKDCASMCSAARKNHSAEIAGADVVYTRPDDTFIPLEERTRIANEAKATFYFNSRKLKP